MIGMYCGGMVRQSVVLGDWVIDIVGYLSLVYWLVYCIFLMYRVCWGYVD